MTIRINRLLVLTLLLRQLYNNEHAIDCKASRDGHDEDEDEEEEEEKGRRRRKTLSLSLAEVNKDGSSLKETHI